MATTANVTWLAPARPAARPRTVGPTLREMWHAVRTRRMLAAMDDRQLADIGLSRADAGFEADRKPWDLMR